MTYRSFLLEP